MEYKIYGIYDTKTCNYLMPPMFMKTRGEAIRSFMDIVNDERTTINRHPEDYILFEVGDYDDRSADFQNITPPASCGTALEYIQKRMGKTQKVNPKNEKEDLDKPEILF